MVVIALELWSTEKPVAGMLPEIVFITPIIVASLVGLEVELLLDFLPLVVTVEVAIVVAAVVAVAESLVALESKEL